MYIGSGDIGSLLAGIHTKAYAKLLQRFVSDEKPYWNAKASPIDALRTGAILEERYGLMLDDSYYEHVRATSSEMDVFKCSLDFAKIDGGIVTDFIELKACSLNDFLELEPLRGIEQTAEAQEFIKKKYKKYYNQVQQQLYCTDIDSAVLSFLVVYSYDDEENYTRDIQPNEVIKFRIKRDESVIKKIKERGQIFQQIKDYYESN